jgi:nucleoside-diphosphate-sugar epimerase
MNSWHTRTVICTVLQQQACVFFTVYGPWGRPDMALFLFTKAALEGKAINVFNNGEMLRDFTYIDDIVEGIKRVIDNPAKPNLNWSGKTPDPSTSSAAYKIYKRGMHFTQPRTRYCGWSIVKITYKSRTL